MSGAVRRLLVMAPNWLGDAVMALPAIADVRRHFPSAHLMVAARGAVAGLFHCATAASPDQIVELRWRGHIWRRGAVDADVARLRDLEVDAAILLTNSFGTAWLLRRAGVPERWGYATDLRRPLLTRALPVPRGRLHQGRYYQYLTQTLGVPAGPLEPVITASAAAVASARALLEPEMHGTAERPLIVAAPGAAYGTAKRWLPAHFARLIAQLVKDASARCVLIGSAGDRPTVQAIHAALSADTRRWVIDLAGRTSLDTLIGLLTLSRACVSNDSGAMHLAAAAGVPIVALFGPTNEHETAPLARTGVRADVLTHPVWCRPCMLRECPIDHRCMRRLAPERVMSTIRGMM